MTLIEEAKAFKHTRMRGIEGMAGALDRANDLIDRLTVVAERADNLEEALTPSAETKEAYWGEFYWVNEPNPRFQVPWTVIKEIMAAIRKRGLA